MVGRGTYGSVYKAEVRLHGMLNYKDIFVFWQSILCLLGLVALKELNFISPTPSQYQAFRNEVIALKYILIKIFRRSSSCHLFDVLRKITHQNTLNFLGYMLSPRFAIVTQWCEVRI